MLWRQCTRVWEPSRRWPRRSSPLSKSIQTAGRRWWNLRRGKDFQPVFRIILVRIRVRGSIPLTNGSGSFSFRQWPSRCQQLFKRKNFLLIIFTFSSFFTDKKLLKSHKTAEIKVFLTVLFFLDGRIHIRIRIWLNGSGSGRHKNLRIRNTASR